MLRRHYVPGVSNAAIFAANDALETKHGFTVRVHVSLFTIVLAASSLVSIAIGAGLAFVI